MSDNDNNRDRSEECSGPHSLICYEPAREIIDSSKLTDYQTCPRKFFFAHILGWRPSGSNIHLTFGTAWHKAKEHLRWALHLEGNYSPLALQGAFKHFMAAYSVGYPEPRSWNDNATKSPISAYRGLVQYVAKYKRDKFKVVFTEVAGTVPINNDGDHIWFKIDSLVEEKDKGYVIYDDKTSSSDYALQEKFGMSFQFGTYIHAIKCYLGLSERMGHLAGVVADVVTFRTAPYNKLLKSGKYSSVVNGKGHTFNRIPIIKNSAQINRWGNEANSVVQDMKRDKLALLEEDPSDLNMRAYQCRTTSCSDYGGCPYYNLCWQAKNPMKMVEELGTTAPVGFERSFWNPEEDARDSRTWMEL